MERKRCYSSSSSSHRCGKHSANDPLWLWSTIVAWVFLVSGTGISRNRSILVESWTTPTNLRPLTTTTRRRHRHSTITTAFAKGFGKADNTESKTPSQKKKKEGDPNDATADDDEKRVIAIESLSPTQLTELVELSFVQACYGMSQGDAEPLRLFVLAVAQALDKANCTPAVLAEMVDALPPSSKALQPAERAIRTDWIRAVALVQRRLRNEPDDTDCEVTQTFGPVMADLVAVHKTGMGLNANRFVASRRDVLLPQNEASSNKNILELEPQPAEDDLGEAIMVAVATQTVNVLYIALVCLSEEDDEGAIGAAVETDLEGEPKSSSKKKKKTNRGSSSSSGGGRGFG